MQSEFILFKNWMIILVMSIQYVKLQTTRNAKNQ